MLNSKKVIIAILVIFFCGMFFNAAYAEELFKDDSLRGVFIDSRDGCEYSIIKIGKQWWMQENLRYLPSVVGPETGSESEPYYYVYDYYGTDIAEAKATANYSIYGVLYNWPAVMAGQTGEGAQGICPAGWHIPTDAEWTELTNYVGANPGTELKAAPSNIPPWTGVDGYSFTVLPAGHRDIDSNFYHLGSYADFWTSTETDAGALYRCFSSTGSTVHRGSYNKASGFPVRCIRD